MINTYMFIKNIKIRKTRFYRGFGIIFEDKNWINWTELMIINVLHYEIIIDFRRNTYLYS